MREADRQRADPAERGAADAAAAPVGHEAVARLGRRDHVARDEVAIGRAAGLVGAGPRHRGEIAAAHAVVRGDADHDERRQLPRGERLVELTVEAPAAVPGLASCDLQRERRVEVGRRWVPLEQVVAVVEVERGVAAPGRAVVAWRQVDQHLLRALERRRRQREALEAVRGVGTIGGGRRRAAGRGDRQRSDEQQRAAHRGSRRSGEPVRGRGGDEARVALDVKVHYAEPRDRAPP